MDTIWEDEARALHTELARTYSSEQIEDLLCQPNGYETILRGAPHTVQRFGDSRALRSLVVMMQSLNEQEPQADQP